MIAIAGSRADARLGRMRFGAAVVGLTVAALCPTSGTQAADPAEGKALYESHCSRCHGDDGRGLLGGTPDFTRGMGLLKPDVELVRGLRVGIGGMPAYEGLLRQDELLDVIAYVRSLQQ